MLFKWITVFPLEGKQSSTTPQTWLALWLNDSSTVLSGFYHTMIKFVSHELSRTDWQVKSGVSPSCLPSYSFPKSTFLNPVGSGFSRPDIMLQKERNHSEQPFHHMPFHWTCAFTWRLHQNVQWNHFLAFCFTGNNRILKIQQHDGNENIKKV